MAILREYFKLAFKNLKTRRLRNWLTILGIVVGVFLVITLISLSGGIRDTITKQLKSLGGDVIFVLPGSMDNMMSFFGGEELSKEDIKVIEKVKGVDIVLPTAQKTKIMRYENEQKTVFLIGLSWDDGIEILTSFQGWSLNQGEWPSPGKRELLIGSMVAKEDFFGTEIKAGDEAVINGKTFKIAGVLNSLGSKTDDTAVYLDISIYEQVTGDRDGGAQAAMVKVEEGANVEKVAERIEEALDDVRKRRRGEDVSSFSVLTSDKMGNIVGGIIGIIQASVMVFASIAILVGGLGIMNSMFTAVRERTREIGLLKAVGAKNSAVISIFLIESAIIGFVGGMGGVILGLGIAKGIELYGQVHTMFYLEAYMPIGLIIFSLFFSLLIGCLSGYFPARRASKLKPTEALRSHE
ncbi:MAG: ABC transporter permease [Patescibacteria group bacterium]|nr:ABC transporter permease [Patescibacteria group bacterium]